MKKLFKENSKSLLIICILETILSLYFLIYFSYMDKLNYIESNLTNTSDLALLIQNMYTSTWWALIISFIILISILTITSIIYKKQEYHFIAICLWIMLFILALDFNKSISYNLSNIAIFIPIIFFNLISYKNQKNISKK